VQIFVVILTVAGIGVFVTLVGRMTNRSQRRRLTSAQALIKERLKAREELSRDRLLKPLASEDQKRFMWAVMEGVAGLLGVEPGRLRSEECLDDILTVQQNDAQHVSVLTDEALTVVEKQLDRKRWTSVQQEMNPPPDSEDDWTDALFKLPLRDLAGLMARHV